jgi:hypothetical protein
MTNDFHIGLQIDTGGAKGFIPIMGLIHLEKSLGWRVFSLVDIMVGGSIGAIEAAALATGKLSAQDLRGMMRAAVPKIFTRSGLVPLYPRGPFRAEWDAAIGPMKLGDVKVPLVLTAVNQCDGEPEYFTSDNPAHADLRLRDVVEYSFAAPVYFGGIPDPDPKREAVWLDGGTGIDGCSLLQCLRQMMRRGWLTHKGRSHVLSLGCGHYQERISRKKATSWLGKNWRQLKLYWSHDDGGLARRQSIADRVSFTKDMDFAFPNFSFNRLDCEIPKKMDIMDGKQFIDQYEAFGLQCVKDLDLAPFQERLDQRCAALRAQAHALHVAAGGRA